MKRLRTQFPVAGIVVVILATQSGCADRHVQAVNTAKLRWSIVRSTQMLALANQQFEMGDLEQAEATVRDALAQDGNSAHLLILAGRIALERGRLERSYHYFEKAISGNPDIAQACYYQGMVFQRWSQHEAALRQYQHAYDLEADNVAYLMELGRLLLVKGDVAAAVELF